MTCHSAKEATKCITYTVYVFFCGTVYITFSSWAPCTALAQCYTALFSFARMSIRDLRYLYAPYLRSSAKQTFLSWKNSQIIVTCQSSKKFPEWAVLCEKLTSVTEIATRYSAICMQSIIYKPLIAPNLRVPNNIMLVVGYVKQCRHSQRLPRSMPVAVAAVAVVAVAVASEKGKLIKGKELAQCLAASSHYVMAISGRSGSQKWNANRVTKEKLLSEVEKWKTRPAIKNRL